MDLRRIFRFPILALNSSRKHFASVFFSPLFLLGVVLLAPFLPILLHPARRVLGNEMNDNPAMFYYYNYFAGHCWRQGSIPLWNPYVMLGHPFLGEGQAAIFHPLSWLFIALPAGVAINWISALCFLFAGLAFYGYLRALRLSKDTSFAGALVWSFSNVMISRIYAGHLTITLISFELPLLFLLWERYRQSRDRRWLVGLSFTYTLMILAAYPQFLYIFSLFFLLYVLVQTALDVKAPGGVREQGRIIVLLGIFVMLGIGMGLVQLLPAADFASQSARTKVSYRFSGVFSFDPENLLTFVVPRFFGYTREPGPAQYWGRDMFWEMWAYFGILPLILVLPGILAAPPRRRIPLLVCAVVFFVIALGRFTPLFPLVYKFVPLFNVFRGPSKNMMVTEFCLVTFSAFGLQGILHPLGGAVDRRRLKCAFLVSALLLLLVFILYFYYIPGYRIKGSHWQHLLSFVQPKVEELSLEKAGQMVGFATREILRAAFFCLLTLGWLVLVWRGLWRRTLLPLALLLILADTLCVFVPLISKTYAVSATEFPPEFLAPLNLQSTPWPPRVLCLQFNSHHANISMRHEFSSPSGYTGNVLLRYNNFINGIWNLPPEIPEVIDPAGNYHEAMRCFSFDAVILPLEKLKGDMELITKTTDYAMVRYPLSFPRTWLAAAPRLMTGADEVLPYILISDGDILQRSPAVERCSVLPPNAPLGADETVKITAFTPNRVELKAHAAQSRLLVLNEMYEKNWTATVGGKSTSVFPANYLFRGVIVPAGDSQVVFEYRPASFRRGALFSLLALTVLLGLGLRAGLRKPLPPPTS